MDYKERYNEWLSNPYFDADTKAELASIREDENEIKERFYTDLEFGTAGTARGDRSRNEQNECLHGQKSDTGTCKLYCKSRTEGKRSGNCL